MLVYLADLDPSGVAIPKSIQKRLREYGGLDVELYRAALNPEQVVNYSLPGDPEAAKDKDPNYKRWLKEYGGQAPVELDALHPQVLSEITVAALQRFYDMEEFQEQEQRELEEAGKMAEIKRDAEDYLYANWPEVFCAAR